MRFRLPSTLLALAIGIVLPIASMLPARAAEGASVKLLTIHYSDCREGTPYLQLSFVGDSVPGSTFHFELWSGGKVYHQEHHLLTGSTDQTRNWHSYGTWDASTPAEQRGTWPLPAGQHLRYDLSLTDSAGAVLDTWTTTVDSCDSGVILYNGPGESDADDDLVSTKYDLCPQAAAPATKDGCPVVRRTLSLTHASDRLPGRLTASHPALHRKRTVMLYRVGRGADQVVATTVTDTSGRFSFSARRLRGDLYASTAQAIEPTIGRAPVASSRTIRLR